MDIMIHIQIYANIDHMNTTNNKSIDILTLGMVCDQAVSIRACFHQGVVASLMHQRSLWICLSLALGKAVTAVTAVTAVLDRKSDCECRRK